MGIKIGKIQTREYMSRLEMSDKVLVLCFKAEPLFSTIFSIERVSESVHVSLPPRGRAFRHIIPGPQMSLPSSAESSCC